MTESFDFRAPDHFVAGTVGPPGRRTFYLQASEGHRVVTLKLEKQQVTALADYLETILRDLAPVGPPPGTFASLREPFDESWVVGPLGVAYDERDDRVVLVAEELQTEDETADPATARFHLDREQVAAFIEHARSLVGAGRPLCTLCGQPMDPEGHVCPRSN